ncbi:MAG TPA: tRNA pseudouridine(38-40) synthase TruA [Vicinamibacterales bacterium]
MPTFKIIVAYDGTDYVGWQRQANGVSIQALIEESLRALDERDVTVHGAGRTDAGVHAFGQVAAFALNRSLPPAALVKAINARLPAAIRVLSAEEVPSDFQPRFAARDKTYRYRIWNAETISPFESRYAWHIGGDLNVPAMRSAAALLVGCHDFAAFQAAGSPTATTEREILALTIEGDERVPAAPATHRAGLHHPRCEGDQSAGALIACEVTGNGFLRHMVRTIVGTLVEVGRGRQAVEWVGHVLATRERSMAGPTAPPQGLFLVGVSYGALLADKP